jgi:hypothetical protein
VPTLPFGRRLGRDFPPALPCPLPPCPPRAGLSDSLDGSTGVLVSVTAFSQSIV